MCRKRVSSYKACEQQQRCFVMHSWRRKKVLQDQELRLGTLPTEEALSMHWIIEEDKLGFKVLHKERNAFDGELNMWSFGIGFSFVGEGRQIIQMLYQYQLACIDLVDKEIQQKWTKWKMALNILINQGDLTRWLVAVFTFFLMLLKVVMSKLHMSDW